MMSVTRKSPHLLIGLLFMMTIYEDTDGWARLLQTELYLSTFIC